MVSSILDEIIRAKARLEAYAVPSYELCPDKFWPKNNPDGTETKVYEGHPITKWLAKYLGFDPNTYLEVPKFTWNDPIIVDLAAISLSMPFSTSKPGQRYKIIASPEQIEQIKAGLK